MENKNKNKINKKRLSYLVSALVIICVLLLVAEIVINTQAEINANRLNEGYAVNAEFDASGAVLNSKPTLAPTPTWDPSIPTPTYNINVN